MKKTNSLKLFQDKGFTLIELLIVIAIIGILATIVVVSLRGASDKARNAKIITDVTQIRKITEDMYVQSFNGYSNLCSGATLNTTDPNYGKSLEMLETDIEKYNGSISSKCYSSQYSYCVSAKFTGENAKYFCIDDEGHNAEFATEPCTSATSQCE